MRFGAGYLLNKDLQFDSAVTFNFKDTPEVFGVNFGVSYRIDRHSDMPGTNKGLFSKFSQKKQRHSKKNTDSKKFNNIDEK